MSSCCPARPGRIVGDIVDTVSSVVASDVAAPGADNVAAPADVAATDVAPADVGATDAAPADVAAIYAAPADLATTGADDVAATADVAASKTADNEPA